MQIFDDLLPSFFILIFSCTLFFMYNFLCVLFYSCIIFLPHSSGFELAGLAPFSVKTIFQQGTSWGKIPEEDAQWLIATMAVTSPIIYSFSHNASFHPSLTPNPSFLLYNVLITFIPDLSGLSS